MLLVAWGLAGWFGVSPERHLRTEPAGILWGVLATVPLLLGLAWMLATGAGPVRRLVEQVVGQIGSLVAPCTRWQLGCLAVIAGLSEEVLFRGVIQVGLTRWLSAAGALVVASLVFGLVHAASRTYALFAGIMGLYLGTLFLLQNSLVPPIIAHALYDFVALDAVARRSRHPQG